jgi:hypothetical protein
MPPERLGQDHVRRSRTGASSARINFLQCDNIGLVTLYQAHDALEIIASVRPDA